MFDSLVLAAVDSRAAPLGEEHTRDEKAVLAKNGFVANVVSLQWNTVRAPRKVVEYGLLEGIPVVQN